MVQIITILLLIGCIQAASSLSTNEPPRKSLVSSRSSHCVSSVTRRDVVALLPLLVAAVPVVNAAADPRSTVTLRLESSNQRAGLKLGDVKIGNPPRTAVAVELVSPGGVGERAGVQPGVILLDFPNAKSAAERLRNGPYPIELKFYNLAAGGDAFGDMGKPLVTATDALQMAKATSGASNTKGSNDQEYVMRVLKQPSSACGTKSRRGDVMEINYEARYGSADGPIYDSSVQRGTNQPYQFVLGSGDMIPGADRGMYDMCPGEVRVLEIPPALGYGPRASKLFDIPSQSSLFWTVELVAVNSVREGDARTREEMEGREW